MSSCRLSMLSALYTNCGVRMCSSSARFVSRELVDDDDDASLAVW